MDYPLVTAMVTCYNHARFVTECLESIRAQNYPNLELIVNDDASRDTSAAIIAQWLASCDIPHRFLHNDQNLGLCRSVNNILSVARGKYIAGIAADDVWLPGKLHQQVELLEHLPAKVGVVYSDAWQIDEDGKPLPQTFIEAHRHFDTLPEGNLQLVLWEGNFVPAMTTLVRRECYERVGPFDEQLFYEDWDMWLRIARHFDFAYSKPFTAKYRLVSTSMVRSQFGRVNQSMCQVCVKHLRTGGLTGAVRSTAALQLYNRAIHAYECASPGFRTNLLQALRYRPSVGLALRILLAGAGLGPQSFGRIRSFLGLSPRPRLK